MDWADVIPWLPSVSSLLGSLFGVLAAGKLVQYRLGQLEKKVDKHNSVVERTYRLEGAVQELQHDVRDLKKYHEP